MIGLILITAALALGYGVELLAELALVRRSVDAYPDTPAQQDARRRALLYWPDMIMGRAFSVVDLIYGLIRNAAGGRSDRTAGTIWALTRIVMYRPGSGHPYAAYSDLGRMLRHHGIVVVWWGFDGDRMFCHVRERQAGWAIYLLRHGPRTGRTWAEQAQARRAARPWAGWRRLLPRL